MCLAETHEAVRDQLDGPAHQGRPVGRRAVLAGGLGATVGALASPVGAAASSGHRRMRDLTWTFSPSFPVFVDGEEAARSTHVTIEENGYYLQRWSFYEHTATHMDAPGHFTPGGRLSPDIGLDDLFVPAVVVDISDKVASDHDAEVTVDDLIGFERRHGRIPRRSAVLMYSGWETGPAPPPSTVAPTRAASTTSPDSTSRRSIGWSTVGTSPGSGSTRSASIMDRRRRSRST